MSRRAFDYLRITLLDEVRQSAADIGPGLLIKNCPATFKIVQQMFTQIVSIVGRSIYKSGLAATEKLQPQDIHAGRFGHAAIVTNLAFAIQYRDLKP